MKPRGSKAESTSARRSPFAQRCRLLGKHNRECRASPRVGIDGNPPAVGVNDLLDDVEAEAQALRARSRIVGRPPERVEENRQALGGNRTEVVHVHPSVMALL